MATANEKLAASLAQLQKLQRRGRRVFRSAEFSRTHRDRLLLNGFLRPVIRGWLISSSPDVKPGDTTPWFASFWEFCAHYCRQRFGGDWHLSPEQSLLLHAETSSVPTQVIVYSPKGANNTIQLPFGTSLYDLKQALPPAAELTERDGLRLFRPAAALVRVPEAFFRARVLEAQVLLAGLRDVSVLLGLLLNGGQTVVAGRVAGAFRRVGRQDVADEIVAAMRAADHRVRETDPFAAGPVFGQLVRTPIPIVGRLQAMWASMRGSVLANFPEPPGLPADRAAYLASVDDLYTTDAYHSLSIEGYAVSETLIERVRSGQWDPDHLEEDRRNRDALAARGYWQAFQAVRKSVEAIISGGDAASLVRAAHGDWYRELFQPAVAAGIIPAAALAGYRNDAVFIRTSRHVPPRWEAVRDAMPALFDLLEGEPEPAVRAVLGHWLVGYIHPWQDGNGRIARFLMNALLASGGYPWTVIRVEDRRAYFDALDQASVGIEIKPFVRFVRGQMQHRV
ncbi:MAG: Fic family protein [Gammaproteobacteria bacterium]|nr:Fic family protein [Gammaproteobacteria bacterium]